MGIAGKKDGLATHAFEQGQKGFQFLGLAAIGKGQDHIALGGFAHVPMERLGGAQEERGGSGGGKGGRDFLAHEPGLPHAGYHNTAPRTKDKFNRRLKGLSRFSGKLEQALRFNFQNPSRR